MGSEMKDEGRRPDEERRPEEGPAQREDGSADAGGGGTGLDEEMRRELREAGEDTGEEPAAN